MTKSGSRFRTTGRQHLLVSFLVVALCGLHAFEFAIDGEHWPFCAYPMYSGLEHERAVTAYRLVGIRADSGAEEPLQAGALLYPFDQSRLSGAFVRMVGAPDAEARRNDAVRDLLRRYEARRLARSHVGPALKGMRLYKTRHELDPWARNVAHPERRDLLTEVTVP